MKIDQVSQTRPGGWQRPCTPLSSFDGWDAYLQGCELSAALTGGSNLRVWRTHLSDYWYAGTELAMFPA